jgi:N6-L-threonylcarbamoyladenine synthase
VASGGHTHLYEVANSGYKLLGKTRDDAAGEAFDKVAKLLGFGYPGGPVIDRLAPHGDPHAVAFTSARMKGNTLDFSFSGLKTAVLRWVESHDIANEIEARKQLLRSGAQPSTEAGLYAMLSATPTATRNLLASFQHAVVDELLSHAAAAAARMEDVRSIVITGGVACNSGLRAAAGTRLAGLPVYFPTPALSTDNAVMIAAAAWAKFGRGEFAPLTEMAEPNAALA